MAASLQPGEFDAMATLGDVARHHGRTRPDQIALSFEGRLTSYAALDRHTDQVAAALAASGVQAGECIAYLGKNSDHYFELVLGASKAGIIMAPIGWRLSPAEAAYIIDDTQAKLLFVGSECIVCAHDCAEEAETKPQLIAMEAGDGALPAYEAWRNGAALGAPRAVAPEDTALLLYTSGTTGRPKGVMLTSANLLRSRRKIAEQAMGWNEWARAKSISSPCRPRTSAAPAGGWLASSTA